MTTAEAAALLRRTSDTVIKWSKRGLLECLGKLPDGGYLWERSAVEALARGGAATAKHASVDPGVVRAFVDQAWKRAKRA